ncbi:hypothetical protein PVAP13_8KG196801, partial [Panicum virgatum]
SQASSSPDNVPHQPAAAIQPTSHCYTELATAVHYKKTSHHDSSTMPPSSSDHAYMIADLPSPALRWQKSAEKPTAPKEPPPCRTPRRSTATAPCKPNIRCTTPDPGTPRQLLAQKRLATSTTAHHSSDTT